MPWCSIEPLIGFRPVFPTETFLLRWSLCTPYMLKTCSHATANAPGTTPMQGTASIATLVFVKARSRTTMNHEMLTIQGGNPKLGNSSARTTSYGKERPVSPKLGCILGALSALYISERLSTETRGPVLGVESYGTWGCDWRDSL